jgi:Zn-dependent M28 family amino/carboxypeptidase
VQAHDLELDRIRFYFNMDSAGAVKVKGVVLNEWPELEPLFKGWSKEMSHPFLVGQSVNAHSDHFPFLLAGVPTAGMESVKKDLSGRGYGHTAYDTLDKVDVTSLREAAALASRLALRLASTEEWPVKRRDVEAVKALFTGPKYEEEAKFHAAIAAHYNTHS